MSTQTIGGFLVSLGLVNDTQSFEAGTAAINKVALATKALFGAALKTSGALFGMAAAVGELQNAELRSASAIGLNVGVLEKWKIACNLAGVDSKNLISSMAQLEERMQRVKLGDTNDSLIRSLAQLGIGLEEFMNLDAEKRIKLVYDRAEGLGDDQLAQFIVKDILGDSGQAMWQYFKRHPEKTLESILAEAKRIQMTTDTTRGGAEEYAGEYREIKTWIKEMGAFFSQSLATELTPVLRSINDFLLENKDAIKDLLTCTVKILAFLTKTPFGAAKGMSETGRMLAEQAANGVVTAMPGGTITGPTVVQLAGKEESPAAGLDKKNTESLLASYKEKLAEAQSKKTEAENRLKKIDSSDISWRQKKEEKEPVNKAKKDAEDSIKYWSKRISETQNSLSKMNDGIIAPGGRITQVAQDDWVFALKDVRALAGAFVPHGQRAVNATYTVNQTVNVNAGRDVAASVRNAAYRGASTALTDVSEKAGRLLQMMPGQA